MTRINFKTYMLMGLGLIFLLSLAAVSASMTIEGGSFETGSELEDKTYASIYVGSEYAGDDVIIQIFYSRDGSSLNDGNMVPVTVGSNGYIDVASADAYAYFPDHAEINLYDSHEKLLDSYGVSLSPESGKQTFGIDDSSSSSSYDSDSSSYSSQSSGSYDSSGSYIGNKNSHKFHDSGCSDVGKMKDKNKVYFSSRDEAVDCGYSPCGHCNP